MVRNGLHEGWCIRLVNDSYSLGRNRDNDLILVDRWISRRHCLFSYIRGAWQVIDLDSTHGILVNAQRVEGQQRLNQGDVLELGEVRIDVSYSPDSPPLTKLKQMAVLEHPAILRIESGRQEGLEVKLENQIYTIGRTRHNEIILSDSTISRRHCLIGRARNEWYILDLNSRHGVLVDGEQIHDRHLLQGNESLQAGEVKMALRFIFDPLASEGRSQRTTPEPMVLQVLDGLHEGWEIPLIHPSYCLGRSRNNDLPLADPSISRIHALFVWNRLRWTVEDLGSSLGIELNGTTIDDKQPISAGDQLRLGDVSLLAKAAFSNEEPALLADQEGPKRRRQTRSKLRIIQALPSADFEQTMAIDGQEGGEEGHTDLYDRTMALNPNRLSADMMQRLQTSRQERDPSSREGLDTVDLPANDLDDDVYDDGGRTFHGEFHRTYSLDLSADQRQQMNELASYQEEIQPPEPEDEDWDEDDH